MRFATLSGLRRLVVARLLVSLLAAAPLTRALGDELRPLPGSPFIFFEGGGSSQVPVVSPDGAHLYVSSFGAGDVILLDVAPDGALAFRGRFPSAPPTSSIGGMVFSPGGDRLYAMARDLIDLHLVATTGELSPPVPFPAQVPFSNPLNGAAYVSLAGGDFLYVNDNAAPNTVSAWRIGPFGAPEFVAAYPTGGNGSGGGAASLIAAPRLASLGARVFVLDAPGQGGTGPSTIAVFDVGPDGALRPVPGSPFDMGERSGSIAVDPSGGFLYAGGGGGQTQPTTVLKLRIGADGALDLVARATIPGMTGKPNGLAVDPSGRWLAFAATGAGMIGVVDAGTLAAIGNGVQPDAVALNPSFTSIAAGVAFDAAGHLFVGHTGSTPIVSVYEVVTAAPPIAACVGTPESPAVLRADPASCAVEVDAANGLAGTCADGGDGLASCTVGGVGALLLGPGDLAIEVVATAPDGAAASCTSFVRVLDVTPPIVNVAPSPALLWPPNDVLVAIDLGASARDACDGALAAICEAVSSEPDDAPGDGAASPDVVWSEGLWLRAERAGGGPGRVYTLACEAADAAGNVGQAAGRVEVPHDLAR